MTGPIFMEMALRQDVVAKILMMIGVILLLNTVADKTVYFDSFVRNFNFILGGIAWCWDLL